MQKNSVVIGGCLASLLSVGYLQNKIYSEREYLDVLHDSPVSRKTALFSIHNAMTDYDRTQELYEKTYRIQTMRKILLRQAQGHVLETGAGTCRNNPYYLINDSLSSVTLLDYAPNMLQVALAKKSPAHIKCKVMDVHAMDFPTGHFDTVVDTFGLESYAQPEVALKEMARVLKPGGKMLLISQGESTSSQLVNIYLQFYHVSHLQQQGRFNNRNMERLLDTQGLSLVDKQTFYNDTIKTFVLEKI